MISFLSFLLTIAAMLSKVESQSVAIAGAAAQTGGSAATGLAQASGQTAVAQASALATTNRAAASASAFASSGSSKKHHPTPPVKYHPVPTPPKKHPVTPIKHHPTVPVKVVKKEPKCEEVYDCYKMDTIKYCGYCIEKKYPTKGHGCTYEEVYGKKTEYVAKCTCDGTFIYKKSACPSCDSVLVELLECAGVKEGEKIEIPESCLKKVGVTQKYLDDCGYIEHPDKPAPKKKVVIYAPPTKYHPAPSKYHPTPSKYHPAPSKYHPTPTKYHPASAASAQASASAIAVGSGAAAAADASAIAVGGGAVAAADATAIAIGN
eukprot:TRINITY_DN376_c0_g1_i15.p1 TRINITY_DN376_c0_g1~~TRINITY_DN376_c0_g1_i15.p1  ORF type:complete len:360 (-),score=48.20 TRINITY_DN376_c0_g1_i15:511-1470(-)